MNEMEIKRHSFEVAKNRLKDFSEKTESELAIDKVQTGEGLFGWFDHKVTGYELNRRLEKIQGNFVAVNTTNNKVIKEFREIYNALDALDKDYIASIVANVKSIEKTSNDVKMQQVTLKQHNEKLEKQQNKLDQHQFDIEKSVANMSKIVTRLKVFQETLEGYKHLTDIDKIWNDCKTIQNETQMVSDKISKFLKKVTDDIASINDKNKSLSEQINRDILNLINEIDSYKDIFSVLTKKIDDTTDLLDNQIQVIKEVSAFTERMKNVVHIFDVDSMWNNLDAITTNIMEINDDVKGNKEEIQKHQSLINILKQEKNLHKDKLNELFHADDEIRESIGSNVYEINCLKEYKNNLEGILHLYDVDSIWKEVGEHKSLLSESEKRDEELSVTIQKNKEELDKNIVDAVQISKVAIESLTKKVRYAYLIAGGAAGLAIIELFLILI